MKDEQKKLKPGRKKNGKDEKKEDREEGEKDIWGGGNRDTKQEEDERKEVGCGERKDAD